MKLNKWYLFLTYLLNARDWIVSVVNKLKFNLVGVISIIVLLVASFGCGMLFNREEIKAELTWKHQVAVWQQEAKQKAIENKVKYIMTLHKSDSLIIYESIMKTSYPVDIAILIAIESEYNPNAISPAKAYGLTQCTLDKFKRSENWNDPETNIRIGAAYYESLLKQFNNDKTLAFAAYNAGPENVKKCNYQVPTVKMNGKPNYETPAYTKKKNKYDKLVSFIR